MRPVKQRPWFIGLLSSLVVDRTLRRCGIAEGGSATAFDRVAYDESSADVPPFAGQTVLRRDLQVPSADRSAPNDARLYTPVATDDAATVPIVIYCHGGGWMLGSPFKQPYDSICSDLCAQLGCEVLSVAYRLAPEHAWPAATANLEPPRLEGVLLRTLSRVGGRGRLLSPRVAR